ncbi:cation transporter [Erysipelothrix sp. HDW6C]|nr:cation transporter [Erysipelothrix sp. HDW6C]
MKDSYERNKIGMKAGLLGLSANLLLSISKIVIGTIANSQAIIADGINNASDSMSSLITVVGFKIAGKPADKEHPYGHERFESIAGFVISLIMIYLGIDILRTSFGEIFTTTPLNVSVYTFGVLILSITVKGFMAWYYTKQANRIDSDMLHASSQDSKNDILMTGSILIGILIQWWFGFNIDAYMGMSIALFIIYSAVMMVRDFVNDLMGTRPDETQLHQIKDILDNEQKIIGYHDLLVHNYGKYNTYASVHIEINQVTSLVEAHEIIDSIEHEVYEETNINLVTHLDPLDIDSEEMTTIYDIIKRYIRANYPGVTFHDVRIIHERLMFDLVLDEACDYESEVIIEGLRRELGNNNIAYALDITIDTQQLI